MVLIGIQSTTLAVTAALTGVVLVAAALIIAWLIGPRSYTAKKGEPYECGIPTRGDSMAQFHVGYYLFAILFLMFDVETVFLFPWATICKEIGTSALLTRSTHDVGTMSWVADMLSSNIITIPVLFFGGVALAFSKDPALALIILLALPIITAATRPI